MLYFIKWHFDSPTRLVVMPRYRYISCGNTLPLRNSRSAVFEKSYRYVSLKYEFLKANHLINLSMMWTSMHLIVTFWSFFLQKETEAPKVEQFPQEPVNLQHFFK